MLQILSQIISRRGAEGHSAAAPYPYPIFLADGLRNLQWQYLTDWPRAEIAVAANNKSLFSFPLEVGGGGNESIF